MNTPISGEKKSKNLHFEECEFGDSDAMGPPLHAQGPHPHSNREKAHCLQSINHPKPGKPYFITKCKRNFNKKLSQPPRSKNTKAIIVVIIGRKTSLEERVGQV